MEKNIPLKKFRAGPVSATVWENKTKEGKEQTTYSTISIERSYMDKDGKWQSTNSMRVNDLPKVALVTNKAYEFVLTQKHDIEVAA